MTLFYCRHVTYRGRVRAVEYHPDEDLFYLVRVINPEVRNNTEGAMWKPYDDGDFMLYARWQLRKQPDGALQFFWGKHLAAEILAVSR